MEATIVVLIDYEEQVVRLFGEHTRNIPFHNAFLLPVFLKDKTVLYIKEGEEVDGNDVISTVYELPLETEPEKHYIHSTVKDYIKTTDVRMTFAGPRDIKPLEKYGYDVFERSPQLAAFLKDKKVEIISETEATALKKKMPVKSSRDASLTDMIISTSAEAFVEQLENDSMFNEENDINDEDGEVYTEAEQMIRKGIGRRE